MVCFWWKEQIGGLVEKGTKIIVFLFFMSWGVFFGQNAGEESVANIDKLRHANGSQTTADIRHKMQKVKNQQIYHLSPYHQWITILTMIV